ncbi:MAG: sensor histidine kinase [Cyclobacteriaceae bacterium]
MSEEHIEMIQLGSLLFLSAYHVILFFQIKRNYYLYLGLLGIMIFIRALLVDDGSRLLYSIFSSMDQLEGRKIEYLAAYSTLALAPMFIGDLFKFTRFEKYVKILKVEGLILMAFVLVMPYSIYRYTLDIYHISMVGAFVLMFAIIFHAIKKKRTGARHILYGAIICFAFVLVEMLRNSRAISSFDVDGPNLVNTGVLAYFLFQSIALSAIYAKSFRENEQLNKELEERVSTRTEQLSKSNLIKERFLKIVSHDLRAPLGSLKSMLALLEAKSINEEQSQKLREKIGVSLKGSLDLLDDLLEWTQATSESKVQVRKERVNIVELIQSTVVLFEEIAQSKNIELTLSARSSLPVFVESDSNVARVVLRNLVNNAIKFTEKNGSVRVGVKRKGKTVEVHIEDDGIGIPDEMKQSIFEMESKNKRSGTHNEKSTGVGLALCKDLIFQNGGKIWVEDNAPKGTIFKFTLELSA